VTRRLTFKSAHSSIHSHPRIAPTLALAMLVGVAACAEARAQDGAAGMEEQNTNVPATPSAAEPRVLAGIELPSTPLAAAAEELGRRAYPESLYNHALRTYVFGAVLLRARAVAFDPELAFVAAMLHDIGLVAPYVSATEPFEVDGADAAVAFLEGQGVAGARAQLVWNAVALHTNAPIARRQAGEIALVNAGAGVEAAGIGYELLPPEVVDEVVAALPRLSFKEFAVRDMIKQCETKPYAYVMHPLAEVGRRHIPNFPVPTIEDLMLGSPFAE
jgi:hypothetical protein